MRWFVVRFFFLFERERERERESWMVDGEIGRIYGDGTGHGVKVIWGLSSNLLYLSIYL